MPWPLGSMVTLNKGWPFGDGPGDWPVRAEPRDPQVHLVCDFADCGVSIFPLVVDDGGYKISLNLLRSRVADHCLKMHADDLGDAIRT